MSRTILALALVHLFLRACFGWGRGYAAFRSFACLGFHAGEVIQRIALKEDRFGFEAEITAKISKLGVRIYEVPISYNGRTYAEGKKINWRDGFSALRCVIHYNFF